MSEDESNSNDKESQIEEMREWFFRNYERPEESTPYDGGYIYIWGGPYEAGEELHSAFDGEIPEDVIDELAGELEEESWEWAGIPGPEDFDDYTYNAISSNTEFHETFTNNMSIISKLLDTSVSDTVENNYLMLLFVSAITGLETYLSDAFINTIMNDKVLIRKFVENNPEFLKEKISISDIYNEMDDIEKKIRKYLLDLMWHNLAKIKPMYKTTLDIDFPDDLKELFRAVVHRYDIVHRNGKTKEGENLTISRDNVLEVITNTSILVTHIDNQLPTESN